MLKISKSLGFLTASVFLITLNGCAPDRVDSSVMNVQFHNQLRSDCLQLDLKISTLNPDQMRAVSQCLNSHGDLGAINDLVQSATNDDLTVISNWVNQEILSQPYRLSSLEKIFIELSRRKIIDDQFLALGNILSDEKVLNYITDHFQAPAEIRTFSTRESLLSLSEMGAKLFSSPQFIELKPILTDLIQNPDLNLIFEHQSDLAIIFNKTHEAISISDHSPIIDLAINTQKLINLTKDAKKSATFKKIIAQTGLLMRSGKLKNILFIISKLLVSKEDAIVRFENSSPVSETNPATEEPADQPEPTPIEIQTTKDNLRSLFNVIQKNPKIIDGTLKAFSLYSHKEKEFSDWILTHPVDLKKIEELVIQSDLDLPIIKNPAIKFMNELGQAERSLESKSVDQTYLDIVSETDGYEKFVLTPGITWITPAGIKKRMKTANQLLPAIGKNLHSVGLDFFRDLFFELDLISTKNHNGLRAVTAFCQARLISGIVSSSSDLSLESNRISRILKFVTRNASSVELNELLKAAVGTTGQLAFFETYDELSKNFNRARTIGSNSAKLLAIAGFYTVPEFDEWLLKTFKEMLLKPSHSNTDSFLDLLSHPVVTSALPTN